MDAFPTMTSAGSHSAHVPRRHHVARSAHRGAHRASPDHDPQRLRQRRHHRLRSGDPKRRGAGGLLRRLGPHLPALRGGARPREPGRADRGPRPKRADAPPHGAHRRRPGQPRGLAAGSLRGGPRRRHRLGAGRDRHAEPHRDHGRGHAAPRGGRLPSARDARLSGGRGRGGRRGLRGAVPHGPGARRGPGRLRHHGERRRAGADAGRARPPPHRRREGRELAPDRGARHAGARLAAVPLRQRARDGRRGRAADRRLPAEGAHPGRLAPLRRGRPAGSRTWRAP